MQRGSLLLIAAVAIACVAALAALRAGDAAPVEPGVARTTPEVERAPLELREVGATASDARDAVATPAAPAPVANSRPAAVEQFSRRNGSASFRVVRAEDGAPIAGLRVELKHGETFFAAPGQSQRTDAEGLARFERLEPGAWEATAIADGRSPGIATVVVPPGAASELVEIRLHLPREVLVRLVDAHGADIDPADYGLDATKEVGIAIALGATCGSVGSAFEAGGVPSYRTRWLRSRATPLRWTLELKGAGACCVHAVLGPTVIAAAPLDDWAREVALVVDRDVWLAAYTPVVVRVVGAADGLPIAGAHVTFGCAVARSVRCETDAEGRARAEKLLCGEIDLTVGAPGHALAKSTLTRPVQGEHVVRLQIARRIAGVLLDQDGAPLGRGIVGVYASVMEGPNDALYSARTEADGSFEAVGLAQTLYVLRMQPWGVTSWPRPGLEFTTVDCTDGDVAGAVVRGSRHVPDTGGPAWDPQPFGGRKEGKPPPSPPR